MDNTVRKNSRRIARKYFVKKKKNDKNEKSSACIFRRVRHLGLHPAAQRVLRL